MDQGHAHLEVLRGDTSFVLYRERTPEGEPFQLILALKPGVAQSDSIEILERELALARWLDADWAILPRARARFEGRLALILDDPGGELLSTYLQSPRSLSELLPIAIELAATLKKLHATGVLHRDIKPANVMLDGTARVWLTGFGNAMKADEAASLIYGPHQAVAGTLPYMAPEQTGRINRAIDERSDLYALGVTFYEMLSGRLPFDASSPAEWIHAHIAREPFPLHRCNPAVPPALEAIINKLLSKVGDDRYQSAKSLEADLRKFKSLWVEGENVAPFPLASNDHLGGLTFTGALYGREEQLANMVSIYERVLKTGQSGILLISGDAGTGKSALVAQLQSAISNTDALFAAGKFDQFKRGIPYATVAQAFRALLRRILGLERDALNEWRDRLLDSLGTNAGFLVPLVPELSHILGNHPPPSDLQPLDGINRFHVVFRRFLQAFARTGQPLVLFIDDLQWLDEGTIELLERLVQDHDVRNLLLICAFRDGEVERTHALKKALESMRAGDDSVVEIALQDFTHGDVERLLTGAMRGRTESIAPLADLVLQKTGGNPFFAVEFLRALYDQRLLIVDSDSEVWRWNLQRIEQRAVTDNVAELLANRLARLAPESRDVLMCLACMGSENSAQMLSIALALSPEEIMRRLKEPLEARLVQSAGPNYAFTHDRVQEAAYGLIPAEERKDLHARVGCALLAGLESARQDEYIFDIADQFSRGVGSALMLPDARPICRVYLAAGRRAKFTSAYVSALSYTSAGLALIRSEDCDDDLRFALELEFAECKYLTNDLADAERRLLDLATRAHDRLESASVVRVQSLLYLTLGRLDRAVEVSLDCLRVFGMDWPAHPDESHLDHEFALLKQRLAGRSIESLVDLPLLRDPDWRAAMDVLGWLIMCAQFMDQKLEDLVLLRIANLSLEFGNCDASSYAFVNLTLVLGLRYRDYESGRRFGLLGLALVDKRGLTRFKSRTNLCFSASTAPWTINLESCIELLRQTVDLTRSEADLVGAAASSKVLVASLIFIGAPLAEVDAEAERFLKLSRGMNFAFAEAAAIAQLLLSRELRGDQSAAVQGSLELPSVDDFERQLDAAGAEMRIPRIWHWVRQLQARYHSQDYAAALDLDRRIRAELYVNRSFIEPADYHFYAALTHAAVFDAASADDRPYHPGEVDFHHGKLEEWARSCPANFEAQATLIAAEIARMRQDEFKALCLYEQAAAHARQNGRVNVEAMAAERTAIFLIDSDCSTSADAHLRLAHDCYARWGARKITERLERTYPQLLAKAAQAPGLGASSISLRELDMAAVVQMSQAVSSEIVIERLIERLMSTLVEHAGAVRGLLLLPRGGEMRLVAEAFATTSGIKVEILDELELRGRLPLSVVHFVSRTQETVRIEDAQQEGDHSVDPYFKQAGTRAALCLPVKKQGRLVGILYFDNPLSPNVFTADRVQVLQLLASQAAISIENAELFRSITAAQEIARQAGEELRIAYDSIPTLAWRTSADSRLEFANKRWHDYTGIPGERADLEDVWQRTIHPEDIHDVLACLKNLSQDGVAGEVEARMRRHDGKFRRFLLRASPMRDETGAILKWHGTSTDVEDIKLAGEAQQALARASRLTALGEITVSIAHEVNQPLMAIVTNAATCMRWLEGDPINVAEARLAADRIIRDGHRAGDVIASIRAMARKNAAHFVRIDVNSIITEVLQLTRNELERNFVQVSTALAESARYVLGDRVQVQQVVLNLVLNSIEAMGSVATSARLLEISSTDEEPKWVIVSVTDTGPGLDPDASSKVFDAFYTTKADGVGIGLSICRSIIERHGGKITACPNPPRGTTFRFSLPVAE